MKNNDNMEMDTTTTETVTTDVAQSIAKARNYEMSQKQGEVALGGNKTGTGWYSDTHRKQLLDAVHECGGEGKFLAIQMIKSIEVKLEYGDGCCCSPKNCGCFFFNSSNQLRELEEFIEELNKVDKNASLESVLCMLVPKTEGNLWCNKAVRNSLDYWYGQLEYINTGLITSGLLPYFSE